MSSAGDKRKKASAELYDTYLTVRHLAEEVVPKLEQENELYKQAILSRIGQDIPSTECKGTAYQELVESLWELAVLQDLEDSHVLPLVCNFLKTARPPPQDKESMQFPEKLTPELLLGLVGTLESIDRDLELLAKKSPLARDCPYYMYKCPDDLAQKINKNLDNFYVLCGCDGLRNSMVKSLVEAQGKMLGE